MTNWVRIAQDKISVEFPLVSFFSIHPQLFSSPHFHREYPHPNNPIQCKMIAEIIVELSGDDRVRKNVIVQSNRRYARRQTRSRLIRRGHRYIVLGTTAPDYGADPRLKKSRPTRPRTRSSIVVRLSASDMFILALWTVVRFLYSHVLRVDLLRIDLLFI